MRGQFLLLAIGVIASFASCAPASAPSSTPRSGSGSSEHAVGRSGASHKQQSSDGAKDDAGPVIGEYDVRYDGKGELSVDAKFTTVPGELFAVESGAEPFVRDLRASFLGQGTPEKGLQATPSDRSFILDTCARSACAIHYRYLLREASKKLNDLDTASEEGSVIEAPPSTWLLAPSNADGNSRIRFRVSTPDASTSFVTGVFRAKNNPNAWEIAIGDLWTAPYSAFGPLRIKELKAGKGEKTAAKIQLAIAPGKLTVTDDEIASWTNDAAKAIVTYFERFPIPEALIIIVPGRGGWVGEGKTLSGGGGAIFVRVGEKASVRALRQDWVLVHEMTHLAFPSVARENDWAEEGLATYVEPFARARAGTMTEAEAWEGLVHGLPQGLPAAGDKGLDRTPTWGRTYWGGALFYLLTDVDIRKRTNNKMGLEHALRGILSAGGNNAHRWSLDDAFAAGDKALGVPALKERHDAMGTSPHPVDLDKLWRELGILRDAHGKVRFDDAAPLASVRRAMTTP
jgi:hypothetical protein